MKGITAVFDQSRNNKQPSKQMARPCLMHSSLAMQLTPLPLLIIQSSGNGNSLLTSVSGKIINLKGGERESLCVSHAALGEIQSLEQQIRIVRQR